MNGYKDITHLGAKGDGVTDNAEIFNEAFIKYKNVYIPDGLFMVGKTLKLPSGTHIFASQKAHIKLMAGAQKGRYDFLLTNADNEGKNSDISIDGGIWDGNCGQNNRGNNLFNPTATTGTMLNFKNVDGLSLTNMVLKNPLCYYVRFCLTENVIIDTIRFESEVIRGNQDGLHFTGYCKNFVIKNLTGTKGSPNDDYLAINADDTITRQENFDTINGPIENFVIENVYSEACYCFVRLLSVDSTIRNVTIRNINGAYYSRAINMDAARYCATPMFKDTDRPNGTGDIDNVLIENVSVRKRFSFQNNPAIELETNCKNFTLRNFYIKKRTTLFARIRKTAPHNLRIEFDELTSPIDKRISYKDTFSIRKSKVSLLSFNKIEN